ncbi:MAG: Competence protein A [bacterium ADurb.Bin400]|nr:MAG: Competence protein A [bacterium ADurb.Bin400]
MSALWSLTSSKGIFGLDIGFETMKLVELRKENGKNRLLGASNYALTKRILEKDKFQDKAATAEMIKKACLAAKPNPITAKKIVSALPETFVFSKTIQMPKMSPKEYEQALPMEAAQYIPIPIEEMYLDHQVLMEHANEPLVDLLLVATPKQLVDDYVEVAQMAGCELVALETKPLAAGRALLSKKEPRGSLILEIGTVVSRISVWNRNNIMLTTTVSVGKNTILPTIKEGEDQLFGHSSSQQEVVEPIVEEVTNVIRYHQNRYYSPKPIERILLCGSGACFKGIDKYFEKSAGIKTNIAQLEVVTKDRLDPEFVTSFGLALRDEYE